jgi:hypothetical protein
LIRGAIINQTAIAGSFAVGDPYTDAGDLPLPQAKITESCILARKTMEGVSISECEFHHYYDSGSRAP